MPNTLELIVMLSAFLGIALLAGYVHGFTVVFFIELFRPSEEITFKKFVKALDLGSRWLDKRDNDNDSFSSDLSSPTDFHDF